MIWNSSRSLICQISNTQCLRLLSPQHSAAPCCSLSGAANTQVLLCLVFCVLLCSCWMCLWAPEQMCCVVLCWISPVSINNNNLDPESDPLNLKSVQISWEYVLAPIGSLRSDVTLFEMKASVKKVSDVFSRLMANTQIIFPVQWEGLQNKSSKTFVAPRGKVKKVKFWCHFPCVGAFYHCRCHIYVSGCGCYRQIQYLTVMYHHSNSVTNKLTKLYKTHPVVWCRPVNWTCKEQLSL